ncbi:hypothetical protein PR048_006915 [Dryococelus australis]|uniref:Endonuclease/exonuclease/phosphatase domain-containing protein n=1 Tax=Dryococelus australis TaxID=614101 RepID=A0ABQ9IC91_9NEOP|nr:hypothetical protein PR048_006915 [Dryococelus australis]
MPLFSLWWNPFFSSGSCDGCWCRPYFYHCMSDVCLSLNACSVLARGSDLSHLLHTKRTSLVALSETWLHPGHLFSMPGYTCHRAVCVDAPHGDMAILVHCSLHHHRRTLPPLASLESIANHITGRHPAFTFVAVYLPSHHVLVLSGDFKCCHIDWHCTVSDFRGCALEQFVVSEILRIWAHHCPMHILAHSDHHPSVLDFFITSGGVYFSSVATWTSLDSDHLPVHTLLNWHLCHRLLDAQMDLASAPCTPMELDVAVQLFVETVLSAAEEAILARTVPYCGILFLQSLCCLVRAYDRPHGRWQQRGTADILH